MARKIERVMVLNLDERKDRWDGQQAVCGVQDVPHPMLERVSAYDSLNYESMDHVIEAMSAEDPDFAAYAEHYKGYEGWVTQTILCVQWTHLKAIKQIIEDEKHTLVLEDDTFLNINYDKLDNVYRWLIDNAECEILYLDTNPLDPKYEEMLKPVVVPDYTVDAEDRLTHQIEPPRPEVFANFRFSSCRARVYSPWGATRMMDIMRTTGLVTEWIPHWLHDPQHRNEKTMLYPDTAYHWLKDGTKDIGWKGYNFGNRSDIIARDVGVFGHHYGDEHKLFMTGVELKTPKGERKEVPLDETP